MPIRLATPEDAARIAALHAANWRATYRGILSDAYLDDEVMADRLGDWIGRFAAPQPNQQVIVAETEGALAGFACVYTADDPRWGSLLENLHVDRALKGQGLGARLMGAAARCCAEQAPGLGLYLWVLEANGAARRFYERLGAVNAEAAVWTPPDSGTVPKFRYAWASLDPLLRIDQELQR